MISILKCLQTRSVLRLVIIFLYLLFVFSLIYLYFFSEEGPPKPVKSKTTIPLPLPNDIDSFACHYSKVRDALPMIDNTMTFPSNSIFFIESSCRPLTSRQACSVESAARANPDRQINLLFTSPITWEEFRGGVIANLLAIDNVEAARINLRTYAQDTILNDKFSAKQLTREDLNMDLIDILKYITIYKYTGTYLGLDVIVARSFSDLHANWIVKQSPASLSMDMFSFSDNVNGRTLADIALNTVAGDLAKAEQNLWSFDANSVMKKVARIWCYTSDIMFLSTKYCPDLQVLEPENFYPISFHDRHKYFQPDEWLEWKTKKIYTYQFWHRFTKYNVFDKKSLFAHLAREYCPRVYKYYGAKFGTF